MTDLTGPGTPAWEYATEASRQIALSIRELKKHRGNDPGFVELRKIWVEALVRDGFHGGLNSSDELEHEHLIDNQG